MFLLFALACGDVVSVTVPDNAPGIAVVPPDSTDPTDSGDTDPGDTADTDTADTETTDTADTGADLPAWTILVFVNGDNDLERWALADINEMEAVGSTDEVNVIVQLDRSAAEATGDGDWSGARRYRVEQDTNVMHIGSPVLEELGDVDSGDVSTVLDFVDWGVTNWPAQHTMLVLWDHGDGWTLQPEPSDPTTKGISYDDTSGTGLSVADGDVTAVVHGAATRLGRPLDVIGFDACTMAQWEVAESVAADADVMVASEDYEDVAGWPYDAVLTDITTFPDIDGAVLGSSVALRFHEIPDSTMSVVNLRALGPLDAALDTLADTVIATGTAPQLFAAAAPGAQGFDGRSSREHDLRDLLERMGAYTDDPAVGEAAAAAMIAFDAAIVANYNLGGAVKASHGFSIWSPDDGRMPPLYARASWSAAHHWDELVAAAQAP